MTTIEQSTEEITTEFDSAYSHGFIKGEMVAFCGYRHPVMPELTPGIPENVCPLCLATYNHLLTKGYRPI